MKSQFLKSRTKKLDIKRSRTKGSRTKGSRTKGSRTKKLDIKKSRTKRSKNAIAKKLGVLKLDTKKLVNKFGGPDQNNTDCYNNSGSDYCKKLYEIEKTCIDKKINFKKCKLCNDDFVNSYCNNPFTPDPEKDEVEAYPTSLCEEIRNFCKDKKNCENTMTCDYNSTYNITNCTTFDQNNCNFIGSETDKKNTLVDKIKGLTTVDKKHYNLS